MGWFRTAHYMRHRLVRMPDRLYSLASGMATGISVSFSPILGTHFVQCLLICWLTRGNIVAAFIGTIFGNPSTFPLIFPLDYYVGTKVLEFFGAEEFASLPDHLSLSYLLAHPVKLMLPLTVGGYICAILVWLPAYFACYALIRAGRKARDMAKARARRRRLQKAARAGQESNT